MKLEESHSGEDVGAAALRGQTLPTSSGRSELIDLELPPHDLTASGKMLKAITSVAAISAFFLAPTPTTSAAESAYQSLAVPGLATLPLVDKSFGNVVYQPFDHVTLVWDANTETNLAGYIVYSQFLTSSISTDVHLQTSLVQTNLAANVLYTDYVTAYNTDAIESDPSQSVTFYQGDVTNVVISAGQGSSVLTLEFIHLQNPPYPSRFVYRTDPLANWITARNYTVLDSTPISGGLVKDLVQITLSGVDALNTTVYLHQALELQVTKPAPNFRFRLHQ